MYLRTGILVIALASMALLGTASVQAGGGCHSDKFTDERGTTVELTASCFAPTVLRVERGEQVTWTNKDATAHAVTGVANSWGDHKQLNEGDSVSHRFDDTGVYPYFCALHPGMVGAVVVGDGSAASSDPAYKASITSAVAPGDDSSAQSGESATSKSGGRADLLTIAAVASLSAAAGLGAALFLTRKTRRPGV